MTKCDELEPSEYEIQTPLLEGEKTSSKRHHLMWDATNDPSAPLERGFDSENDDSTVMYHKV